VTPCVLHRCVAASLVAAIGLFPADPSAIGAASEPLPQTGSLTPWTGGLPLRRPRRGAW